MCIHGACSSLLHRPSVKMDLDTSLTMVAGVAEGGALEKMGRVRRKHIYSKTLDGDVWRHGRVMGR